MQQTLRNPEKNLDHYIGFFSSACLFIFDTFHLRVHADTIFLYICATGSWPVRRDPKNPFRQRAAILAAQAAAAGFVVLLVAWAIESQFKSYDPGGRGRYIRRREGHQAEEGRRDGIAGYSAENSSARAGVQIQFGVFRQVFSSRYDGGEFGGRHASGERRQV